MGVPITFLDKYNPEQFEIIWTTDRGGDGMIEFMKKPHDRHDAPVVRGKGVYKRIFIRNKRPQA
ncbi:MAG: modification methylase, partial [Chloroflexota bacterium]|nr:modification methylase [Chloroflexota bacterium]MCY3581977.1 modification methylase [Chloroflexota bacterium]MDE2651559.1 modification methylase [Chloroflexota bacterium]